MTLTNVTASSTMAIPLLLLFLLTMIDFYMSYDVVPQIQRRKAGQINDNVTHVEETVNLTVG